MSDELNPYVNHNHGLCIQSALREAHDLCKRRNVRLTALREKVLEQIWQSHRPVGAYDILAQLTQGESRPAQPPTVYRALDFLQEQGLVHRIASINAYIGCSHPGKQHNGYFLICERCKITAELEHPEIDQSLKSCASDHGFTINKTRIELTGLCINCQNT
ncbi:Fur family transcriptional regulator [Endozoicomonas sp.]|uniref:Fur family transcriptional regulator n=1 Tax=Endozoicomonas sp. TaxID=1892382 RepID=UPI002887CBB7|nr:Fur family transcriptional regulator [Endozoicomonas sp.]